MKRYTPQNHLTPFGLLTLGIGSIILGLVAGALAYFISTLFYLLFIFALIVGVLAGLAYSKLMRFSKVRHALITTTFGAVTGLLLALGFYGTPYLVTRVDVISYYQENYGVNLATAAQRFDAVLQQETGSTGLWGYMKYRAQQGDEYTTYLAVGYAVLPPSSFTMRNGWLWLYWLMETILFSGLSIFLGFSMGARDYSKSAKDWYDTLRIQIGSVALEEKERLLSFFAEGDISKIGDLVAPEDRIAHPRIELYSQQSEKQKGDVLLSIKQTWRKDARTVKRIPLGQWEATEEEYGALKGNMHEETSEVFHIEEPGLEKSK